MIVENATDRHLEDLFLWVCRHPSQERTIAALEDDALRGLNWYLAKLGVETGVPALIHGLVIYEASERFMNPKETIEDGGAA